MLTSKLAVLYLALRLAQGSSFYECISVRVSKMDINLTCPYILSFHFPAVQGFLSRHQL
jgi:hypothetical protein